jgi:hypothetical protein
MMRHRALLVVSAAALVACHSNTPKSPTVPLAPADAEGYRPLFNGNDLSGWVNVNTAPSTWTWRDGMLVCSGVPTGVLRTEKMYQDFELQLEYRHMVAGGNAGVFVMSDAITAVGQPFTRSHEVQVLDGTESPNYTSHGDVFAIHGAHLKPDRAHPAGWERCLPSEMRAKPAPEWNHYKITCRNAILKLEVNGVEVSGASDLTPRRGYICLESEGSEVHFRNVRIKELSGNKMPLSRVMVATADEGFTCLYNGLDFSGWRGLPPVKLSAWSTQDWRLAASAPAVPLWSVDDWGDCELIVDVRAVEGHPTAVVFARGAAGFQIALQPKPGKVWSRVRVRIEGSKASVDIDGQPSKSTREQAPARGPIGLSAEVGGKLEFANIYVRELR